MKSNVVPIRRARDRRLFVSLQQPPTLTYLAVAAIFHESFIRSELTRYDMFKNKIKGGLKDGECIVFVSLTKHIIQFVWAPRTMKNTSEHALFLDTTILTMVQHRITKGMQWNPLLLQEWARECGIEITNFKDLATIARYFAANE
jgi:hypothetical protein